MVPILSFIIVGEGAQTSRSRGFILSLSYALGMAFVYTALGIAAGLLGEGLAATLQKPWLLTSFAVLIAVMSLAMFDVYQLQMPASLQLLLTKMSERQKGGKLIGAHRGTLCGSAFSGRAGVYQPDTQCDYWWKCLICDGPRYERAIAVVGLIGRYVVATCWAMDESS
jgi:cytochrome c biogenesis protein CcdA